MVNCLNELRRNEVPEYYRLSKKLPYRTNQQTPNNLSRTHARAQRAEDPFPNATPITLVIIATVHTKLLCLLLFTQILVALDAVENPSECQ